MSPHISGPFKLTVKMSEVTLTPHLIDNLASEYYGVVPAVAGFDGSDDCDHVTIEFPALTYLNQFTGILDGYRTPHT